MTNKLNVYDGVISFESIRQANQDTVTFVIKDDITTEHENNVFTSTTPVNWSPVYGFRNLAGKDRLNSGIKFRKQGRKTFSKVLRTYDSVLEQLHEVFLKYYNRGAFTGIVMLDPEYIETARAKYKLVLDKYAQIEIDLEDVTKLTREFAESEITKPYMTDGSAFVYFNVPRLIFSSKGAVFYPGKNTPENYS